MKVVLRVARMVLMMDASRAALMAVVRAAWLAVE